MVRFVRMSFPYFQTDVISLMHGRPEGMKYSQNETWLPDSLYCVGQRSCTLFVPAVTGASWATRVNYISLLCFHTIAIQIRTSFSIIGFDLFVFDEKTCYQIMIGTLTVLSRPHGCNYVRPMYCHFASTCQQKI